MWTGAPNGMSQGDADEALSLARYIAYFEATMSITTTTAKSVAAIQAKKSIAATPRTTRALFRGSRLNHTTDLGITASWSPRRDQNHNRENRH